MRWLVLMRSKLFAAMKMEYLDAMPKGIEKGISGMGLC